ncbi:deoxyribonuclease-2-alpha-like isoform X2 [Eleginops maclovinus]|uniref:deoxyribonuclease-2-alpha-like isoform X2 n=1 Tax=Eleginops maclovinus TaxID=56733 RepID=UPI003080D31A
MFQRTMMALLLTAGSVFQLSESSVTCKNEEGNEVDWYILYKLPLGYGAGVSYLYMDNSTNGWIKSKTNIGGSPGTLANTLKPLFDFYDTKTEGFGYILYNDQPPRGENASTSYGHSKGVVMLDNKTGVWLSHSTPKFPKYRSKKFWPANGKTNGQTFLCVTYSSDQFEEIGLQLKYIHPYSFDYAISEFFPDALRDVAYQIGFPRKSPWFRQTNLNSTGGNIFSSFAKYTHFNDDLYSGLIVENMTESLYVRSWGKSGRSSLLPSECNPGTPHHVYNVKQVKLLKRIWNDTNDHSKWCVAPNSGWTCIADLNRHESQKNRGGGAVCIRNTAVANAFNTIINKAEPCPPSAKREL